MGREVKRVPLDFDWPIGKVWYGYLISTCINLENYGCKECRHFARLKNMEMTDHTCPAFKELEPPEGEGWQMWETTSEGSPMSPVFKTPEELAKWLADNKASAFGNMTATYDEWLNMIKAGHAPSAIMTNGKIISGVAATMRRHNQ